MEKEDLQKNLTITAAERLAKPLLLKKKKKKKKEYHEKKKSKIPETEPNLYKVVEEKKINKSLGQKRRASEKGSKTKATKVDQYNVEAYKSDEADGEKKKGKLLRKKKRNHGMTNRAAIGKVYELNNEVESGFDEQNSAHADRENKETKLRKKRRKSEKTKKAGVDKVDGLYNEIEGGSKDENGKSKKARKSKKDCLSSRKDESLLEKTGEPERNEVYEISSGDEDCSRGMKKWITEYHQSRPGLKILQEKIDDFMTSYDAQEEQARKEREALAAEGGWTVVVHHKGRKKTTDTESGITVGSVAQAAVMENMAKKKSKEVGLDFYRFQKREAQRNEIMALQSKFEQDKKRIQQLRAARKFQPY